MVTAPRLKLGYLQLHKQHLYKISIIRRKSRNKIITIFPYSSMAMQCLSQLWDFPFYHHKLENWTFDFVWFRFVTKLSLILLIRRFLVSTISFDDESNWNWLSSTDCDYQTLDVISRVYTLWFGGSAWRSGCDSILDDELHSFFSFSFYFC